MAANINDKIRSSSSGVRPVSTTVSTLRNTGGTTLACADLTGWPTDTAVDFVTYQVDGQGDVIAGTQTDWKGIVSGSDINSLTVTGGTDAGNAVGDIVEAMPTSAWAKDLTDALLTSLDQDGTLKAGAVDSAAVLGTSVVETAKIKDKAVTGSKVNFEDFSIDPLEGNFSTTGNVTSSSSKVNTLTIPAASLPSGGQYRITAQGSFTFSAANGSAGELSGRVNINSLGEKSAYCSVSTTAPFYNSVHPVSSKIVDGGSDIPVVFTATSSTSSGFLHSSSHYCIEMERVA